MRLHTQFVGESNESQSHEKYTVAPIQICFVGGRFPTLCLMPLCLSSYKFVSLISSSSFFKALPESMDSFAKANPS